MYSQNNEEAIICEYFGMFVGRLTDIGANDGVTFSNSRRLIQKGWEADLIEPSPAALARLEATYRDHPKVRIWPYAIANESGPITLHESDAHHGDNVALLSTALPAEMKRWGNTQRFAPVQVQGKRWDDIGIKPGHFLSIDAEGYDYDILRQIDLSGVRLVCIEYNGKTRDAAMIKAYCSAYGMKEIHRNGENLILAK